MIFSKENAPAYAIEMLTDDLFYYWMCDDGYFYWLNDSFVIGENVRTFHDKSVAEAVAAYMSKHYKNHVITVVQHNNGIPVERRFSNKPMNWTLRRRELPEGTCSYCGADTKVASHFWLCPVYIDSLVAED